jgi:hypothetical protein
MIESVDVRLVISRDPFVFPKDRSELPLPHVTSSSSAKCHRLTELIVVQHGSFYFAAPAPEAFHCSVIGDHESTISGITTTKASRNGLNAQKMNRLPLNKTLPKCATVLSTNYPIGMPIQPLSITADSVLGLWSV